jgi:hypothetical protein
MQFEVSNLKIDNFTLKDNFSKEKQTVDVYRRLYNNLYANSLESKEFEEKGI